MRKNLPAVVILVLTIVCSVWGYSYMKPNEGPARFKSDTLTVNAEAAGKWGAQISQLHSWGVPIEFVTHDEADITFVTGPTECQDVPGFGKACVAGEAQKTLDSRRWVEYCIITLSDTFEGDTREATGVVTHEFGHCLGARHDDTKDSIMGTAMPSKNYTPKFWSWDVTPEDRAQVSRIYG